MRRREPRRMNRVGERGQSIVELLIVAPLLLLMLMGVVDVGRMIFTYIALEEAVQEGATYYGQEPALRDQVASRVTTSSNQPEVAGATVTVGPCSANGWLTVSATYQLPLLTPIVSELLGSPVPMTATFHASNFRGVCPP